MSQVLFIAVLLLTAAAPIGAQGGSSAPLDRLRAHMAEVLRRQPNFTCLETVERTIHGPREDQFRLLDITRLEAALVNGKEMFAFPGSKEFEDNSLRTFVPTGMFGNGYFALYEAAAAENKRTEIAFHGENQQDQKPTLQFDLRVPAESGMEIHGIDVTAIVGYRGSLYADAATLDVQRLDVVAENMPVALGLRQAAVTVEWARTLIGAREILLPSSAELVMVTWMGDTSRNRMRFSDCREFTGKSTVAFGGDSANAALGDSKRTPAKQELRIPQNLTIALRMVSETITDDMAIGDEVRAVLDADLKANGKVLLPKGAAVSGRLVRMTHIGAFTVVGLIFLEAESETAHAALDLKFQRATGPDVEEPSSARRLSPAPKPREGVIMLRPGHYRLASGLLLYWKT